MAVKVVTLVVLPTMVAVAAVPLRLAKTAPLELKPVTVVTAFSLTSLALVFTAQAVVVVAPMPTPAVLVALVVAAMVAVTTLAPQELLIPEVVVEQGAALALLMFLEQVVPVL